MSATSDGAARVPDVSVVIPSWNSARTIGGCLDALLAQVTTLEYEVLVVDSGTDDTAEVVRRYAPRVQLIRSPARLFPGPARNLGLRQARAPLVAFTDTDCLPDPGWLDALHRASAGLTAVGGRILNGTPDSLCGTALYLTEFVEFAGVTPRRYIAALCQPILKGEADIVIGDRQTDRIPHFSALKKQLQRSGSAVVRALSETDVPDVVSGFRALSRDAALQLNILSPFSYTIEMVIQAGKRHMAIASVPVSTNVTKRSSRLFKSIPAFIRDQVTTIVRMYSMYQPLKVFFWIGTLLSVAGAIPVVRFLYFYAIGEGDGHVQSLILGGALLMMGFVAYLVGLVADLIQFNRQLLEMVLERLKVIEYGVITTRR